MEKKKKGEISALWLGEHLNSSKQWKKLQMWRRGSASEN
jgi:hypothetical protein